MAKKTNILEKIKASVLREQISHRGGGIEINLTPFGFEGEKMAAYQNYLGGGMLGRIMVNDTIRRETLTTTKKNAAKLDKIGLELKKYYHSLTNPETEFEGVSFEQNQKMPVSAY
jgi:hypothetical protein